MSSRKIIIKKEPKKITRIGFIIPTTSNKRDWEKVEHMDFFQKVFGSFIKTYKKGGNFEYFFYLGHDDDDVYFIKNHEKIIEHFNLIKGDNMKLSLNKMVGMKNRVGEIWSALAEIASKDCEYLYQIGDDIVILSPDWEEAFIKKLSETNNVGVTGPKDINIPRNLLTQSFVHVTHLKIFGKYYPEEIINWYIDDWITEIYKAKPIENIKVKNCGGQPRYNIINDRRKFLKILKKVDLF